MKAADPNKAAADHPIASAIDDIASFKSPAVQMLERNAKALRQSLTEDA